MAFQRSQVCKDGPLTPAKSFLQFRRNLPYTSTEGPELGGNERRELEQVLGHEPATPAAEHHYWVRRYDIGPGSWEPAQRARLVEVIDPVALPVPPTVDELEGLAGERVERVGHTYTSLLIMRAGCG